MVPPLRRYSAALLTTAVLLAASQTVFAGREYLAGLGAHIAPDQLLVRLEPGADITKILSAVAPQAASQLISGSRNTYLLRLPMGSQASVSKLLAGHPLVRYVEPNRIRHITVLPPNDSMVNQQWALTAIQAVQAWSYFPDSYLTAANTGGTRVRVAVLDTGVDCTHPDFMNLGGHRRIPRREDNCSGRPAKPFSLPASIRRSALGRTIRATARIPPEPSQPPPIMAPELPLSGFRFNLLSIRCWIPPVRETIPKSPWLSRKQSGRVRRLFP